MQEVQGNGAPSVLKGKCLRALHGNGTASRAVSTCDRAKSGGAGGVDGGPSGVAPAEMVRVNRPGGYLGGTVSVADEPRVSACLGKNNELAARTAGVYTQSVHSLGQHS